MIAKIDIFVGMADKKDTLKYVLAALNRVYAETKSLNYWLFKKRKVRRNPLLYFLFLYLCLDLII